MLHALLHLLVPAGIALIWFRGRWLQVSAILWAAILVDLDHLLATPVYDPGRCSIGFHPLHTLPAIALYAALLVLPRTRLVGVGLLVHMALDALDCLGMA